MSTDIITTDDDLAALVDRLQTAPRIGIDTEFVSEDTFHPELCLIQIATGDDLTTIDPQQVDVTPLWKLLAEGDHVTVLHAGREELCFMLRAVDATPRRLFDVQIASGFCSNEYPAAYGSVVNRFLGHQPLKGEQRTDWRRRPLTSSQIQYALEDVRYLLPLHDRLLHLLEKQQRTEWADVETTQWVQSVVDAQSRRDWRRVSGIGKLNSQGLAIVRELWHWRYEEAKRLNQPQRRILRDDLMVEMAKRKTHRPDKILGIRGLQRGLLKRKVDELAACVKRGMDSPEERRPRKSRGEAPQLALLGQFLTPALTTICRKAGVAASLVGGASDVRDLIAYRLDFPGVDRDEPPSLAQGWRAELVGRLIDDLLAGKRSIRIANAEKEDPLVFDEV